jgi:hypothetical protein
MTVGFSDAARARRARQAIEGCKYRLVNTSLSQLAQQGMEQRVSSGDAAWQRVL